MNTKRSRNNWADIASRFSSAPLELRAFAVFSLAATLIGFGLPMLCPNELLEAILPFTGWLPTSGYCFSLCSTAVLIFGERTADRRKARIIQRWLIVFLLSMDILFGFLSQKISGGNDFGNPYLIVSPWRPIWTEVVPALWIAILLSPRVTKFIGQSDELHTPSPVGVPQ